MDIDSVVEIAGYMLFGIVPILAFAGGIACGSLALISFLWDKTIQRCFRWVRWAAAFEILCAVTSGPDNRIGPVAACASALLVGLCFMILYRPKLIRK